MSEKDLQAAIKIVEFLVEFGIPAGQALYRSIRALFGHDLSPEEEAQLIGAMEADARVRAILAHADAAGGG